jgi:TRAP-type mannitol/chloroaromatic compound transport system permease large subunit
MGWTVFDLLVQRAYATMSNDVLQAVPLLKTLQIDSIIFGVMVAVHLQTSFLSPPVAMAAFYLKGIAPPHVTLNQIYRGMYPFLAIQLVTLLLTWLWPELTLWLPRYLYGQ